MTTFQYWELIARSLLEQERSGAGIVSPDKLGFIFLWKSELRFIKLSDGDDLTSPMSYYDPNESFPLSTYDFGNGSWHSCTLEQTSLCLLVPTVVQLWPTPETKAAAATTNQQQGLIDVNLINIFGMYDNPDDVMACKWIEKNASYHHIDNGQKGVWEFVLNLSLDFDGIPKELEPVIENAKANNAAYILFHQGT